MLHPTHWPLHDVGNASPSGEVPVHVARPVPAVDEIRDNCEIEASTSSSGLENWNWIPVAVACTRGVCIFRCRQFEFALLSYLMQHRNVPIDHARLLQAIWGLGYRSELEYLRTYVKRLRKKIEVEAMRPST